MKRTLRGHERNRAWLASVMIATALLCSVTSCSPRAPVASTPAAKADSPFKPVASIQDIMLAQIDPSADYLWGTVASISTKAGMEERQPRTDTEWLDARRRALILIEATNLLVMDGRKVAEAGAKIDGEEVAGMLTAREVQEQIDGNRASFVAFAHSLRDVSMQMLDAIDARNVQGILDTGAALDEVCEACHRKFWYPSEPAPTPSG